MSLLHDPTRRQSALAGLALAVLLPLLASPAAAQTPPPAPTGQTEKGKEEIERLKAWPEVDEETVKLDVERLRKARTEEMGVQARDALVAAGAGVVPFLLPKYGIEQDEDALKRIVVVLDAVTGAEHTRLLAKDFTDRSVRVRTWSLRRAAAFPDPGVLAAAEKAYAAATKRKKRDRDEDEVFAAALCAASAGSFVGFEEIVERAEKDWGKSGQAIHVALTAVRGPKATEKVAPWLADESRQHKTAGLRLIAACGDKETATPLVAPFLDSTDNTLRVAAINALRGIVDGDPPLDKLSVFEAIERANKWKARL